MFKTYEGHMQKQLFGITNILPKKTQEKLNRTIYPIFYEEIFCQIDESKFECMYSDSPSRPNAPINILVSLEILKHLYGLSDEQLFENYYLDLRYKVALGIQGITQEEITLRTFYNFRKRVVQHAEQTGVNLIKEVFDELVIHFLKKTGIKTDIIRMDSTQISSNMKRLTRIELMSRTLNRFLKKLSEEEQKHYSSEYENYTDEEKRKENLRLITDGEKAIERVAKDMHKVLKRYQNQEEYNQTEEYRLLERVLKDQTVVVEEQLRVKEGKDISSDSCQNPQDPDATYRKKRGIGYSGYSMNVTETANPDNSVQLITNVSTQPNIVSDKAILEKEFDELKKNTGMTLLIVDGGYAGEENREKAEKSGVELIETGIKGRKPGKSTEGFEIDPEQGIVKCPMGKEPIHTQIDGKTVQALWSHESCKNCEYRQKCIAKKQKKGMKAIINLKRYETNKKREQRKSKEFKEKKNLRSAIEGTISAMKRSGLNSIQVVGQVRVSIDVILQGVASNFKRYCSNVFNNLKKKEENQKKPVAVFNCAA